MTTRFLMIVGLLGLAACETVEGAGQTVENTGELIQEESNEVQY
ncbi:hypothetical protein SAMN04490244_12037 [Tranquillimonas rosea]|uniref:Entericidin EcnA/B family protein n=1 Tax=Tranquillimonas rosea TaxID=641238 RepID=A0A1H9X8M3_9RHOB|nr:entericidin, EcnA/B family [Tranquillimonas rosea]SES42419.1 hypothetical protein SAMN04490244_12037 [Tranquillimonas rosea]